MTKEERIHKAAVFYSTSAIKNIDGMIGEMVAKIEVTAYKSGAYNEHKIAHNNALEQARQIVWNHRNDPKPSVSEICEEIEKLKIV